MFILITARYLRLILTLLSNNSNNNQLWFLDMSVILLLLLMAVNPNYNLLVHVMWSVYTDPYSCLLSAQLLCPYLVYSALYGDETNWPSNIVFQPGDHTYCIYIHVCLIVVQSSAVAPPDGLSSLDRASGQHIAVALRSSLGSSWCLHRGGCDLISASWNVNLCNSVSISGSSIFDFVWNSGL